MDLLRLMILMQDKDDTLDIEKLLKEYGLNDDDTEVPEDELTVPSRETLEEYLSHEEQIIIHVSKDDED